MSDPQQSHAHHYVPRWYQKRFLKPGQTNFSLLDLNPEEIVIPGGKHRRREVLYPRGPNVCFYQDDLYALRFGGKTTDAMEKWFFGLIDAQPVRVDLRPASTMAETAHATLIPDEVEFIPDEKVEILDGKAEDSKQGDAPHGSIDIMAVITKALESAGLMKPPR